RRLHIILSYLSYYQKYYTYHPELPTFPTRRSSDLSRGHVFDLDGERLVSGHGLPTVRASIGPLVSSEEIGEPHVDLEYLAFDWRDRKSTRLNSSHVAISYAVFCLKIKIKLL